MTSTSTLPLPAAFTGDLPVFAEAPSSGVVFGANFPKSVGDAGWVPVTVSVAKSTDEDLRTAFAAALKDGVLILDDLSLSSPFSTSTVREMFDAVSPELQTRANVAYSKNLVFKDRGGKGDDSVDQKRCIDLSPERMTHIANNDPTFVEDIVASGAPLPDVVSFFDDVERHIDARLLPAFASAAGIDPSIKSRYNYRLVDYGTRAIGTPAPRCGEHRDYGLMTLIFREDFGGLEVEVDGVWRPVPPPKTPPGGQAGAVCVFGWCAQIASNHRARAALHRVRDATPGAGEVVVPRRNSAVVFVAPDRDAVLRPNRVFDDEKLEYVDAIPADDVYNEIARRWKKREGTLPEEDGETKENKEKNADEEEAAPSATSQDDIIYAKFRNNDDDDA